MVFTPSPGLIAFAVNVNTNEAFMTLWGADPGLDFAVSNNGGPLKVWVYMPAAGVVKGTVFGATPIHPESESGLPSPPAPGAVYARWSTGQGGAPLPRLGTVKHVFSETGGAVLYANGEMAFWDKVEVDQQATVTFPFPFLAPPVVVATPEVDAATPTPLIANAGGVSPEEATLFVWDITGQGGVAVVNLLVRGRWR